MNLVTPRFSPLPLSPIPLLLLFRTSPFLPFMNPTKFFMSILQFFNIQQTEKKPKKKRKFQQIEKPKRKCPKIKTKIEKYNTQKEEEKGEQKSLIWFQKHFSFYLLPEPWVIECLPKHNQIILPDDIWFSIQSFIGPNPWEKILLWKENRLSIPCKEEIYGQLLKKSFATRNKNMIQQEKIEIGDRMYQQDCQRFLKTFLYVLDYLPKYYVISLPFDLKSLLLNRLNDMHFHGFPSTEKSFPFYVLKTEYVVQFLPKKEIAIKLYEANGKLWILTWNRCALESFVYVTSDTWLPREGAWAGPTFEQCQEKIEQNLDWD